MVPFLLNQSGSLLFYLTLANAGEWIEERGAKEGSKVELLDVDGKFWTVQQVFTPGIDEKTLREKQIRDRNALPSIGKVR